MSKLDLREAQRDETGLLFSVEKGSDVITSQNQNGSVTFHRLPEARRDIRRDVYTAIADSDGWVTRGDIAKKLGLKKTPWLNGVIEGLVTDGYLHKEFGVWKNGKLVYWYCINQ
jgi:hypothetical protein